MKINTAAAAGSLLGTALGDSLGLPYEGLSAARGLKLMPFPLRQRLFGSKGCLSDDTVQSAIVMQAMALHPDDPAKFQAAFALRLRKWFWCIPPGIGLSTVKACLRLSVGVSPARSGVHSAGNGSAMRSAVIGAALSDYPEARVAFVEATCRVTHTHPMAIAGSQLIALAAALTAQRQEHDFLTQAQDLAPAWNWDEVGDSSGPSGYVVHSVNAALRIWREAGDDFIKAINQAIALGGDTDTVAAMVGGIMGANPALLVFPEDGTTILAGRSVKKSIGFVTAEKHGFQLRG